ncbi:MAG TPA: oligoribonuclease [Candidatus Saccharimonadales bacterium]|nr:oligoribonuclease [Candidatus Saccharimonadales bacterium]
MTDLSKTTPKKLLWLDLEMTGLNPQKDRIVEVGAIVTGWDFTQIASFESGVHHEADVLKKLFGNNPWAVARPHNTQELIDLSLKSPSQQRVEDELLTLVAAHFLPNEPVLLAGNSIHMDRLFIRHWWPRLEARLHYRMLDVSAWKVVMQGKYATEFKKQEAHRALGDISESIDELQFYLSKIQA